MSGWLIAKGFNTATGFKEWLEEKGIVGEEKQQSIADRLLSGEVISYGMSSRLRYVIERRAKENK